MKKVDVKKYLANKSYDKPGWLSSFVYRLICNICFFKKYNIKVTYVDDPREEKGPCFIIYNHLSRPDHVFANKALYPTRYNMVAGYNEFFRKKFKFVFGWQNVIPKRNYMPDLFTIKAISRAIKSGSKICFAPEGLASNDGTNKPIVPGTSSMFKHFKVPVYVMKFNGNFLLNTKWCLDERYGETEVTLKKLFTVEQTQSMSVEEMDDIVNSEFRSDQFAWTKEKHIYWKDKNNRMAQGMEFVTYKCPKCGKEFVMDSNANEIFCKECGNGAHMNNYYEFEPYEGSVIPESPLKWSEMERASVIKEINADPNYSFEDEGDIGMLPNDHYIEGFWNTSEIVGSGKIRVDHSGFHYIGTKNNEDVHITVGWKELYTSITVNDASYLSFYIKGEYYDFFPKNKTCFKFIYLIEEMHRYHINWYKNFKWYDWMYKGMKLGVDNKEEK